MLSERLLIALGLSVAVIGILSLSLILWTSDLPQEQLTAIARDRDGDTVRVLAEVESVRHVSNGTVTLLTLSETVRRKAVVFDDVNVSEGMLLDLEGEVQQYEGEPELVVRRLGTR